MRFPFVLTSGRGALRKAGKKQGKKMIEIDNVSKWRGSFQALTDCTVRCGT